MKKVLFTSHTANFSKFNRPFMRWFAEQGYEVHYASAGEEDVLDCDKHFTVPFRRSPLSLNNLRAFSKLKKIIDAEKYEIIHTHTPMGSVITRLAARKARNQGTRVIYTAHGFHFFNGAPILNWLIYYPIEKIMAHYTDLIITINKEDYERANNKFKTQIRYVHGVGVDFDKFKTDLSVQAKKKIRKSLDIAEDDYVIFYPAEISRRKRQMWLISAVSKLDCKYVLLLAGYDSLNGSCQQYAKQLGIGDKVRFLGYRKDIQNLMAVTDLVASSSGQEGLPVSILEAMSSGLPIVAVRCRGVEDLIEDGYNGYLVNRNNSSEFASKIYALLYDDKLSSLFKRRNQKKIIRDFSKDRVLVDMTHIYTNNANKVKVS